MTSRYFLFIFHNQNKPEISSSHGIQYEQIPVSPRESLHRPHSSLEKSPTVIQLQSRNTSIDDRSSPIINRPLRRPGLTAYVKDKNVRTQAYNAWGNGAYSTDRITSRVLESYRQQKPPVSQTDRGIRVVQQHTAHKSSNSIYNNMENKQVVHTAVVRSQPAYQQSSYQQKQVPIAESPPPSSSSSIQMPYVPNPEISYDKGDYEGHENESDLSDPEQEDIEEIENDKNCRYAKNVDNPNEGVFVRAKGTLYRARKCPQVIPFQH